MNKCLKLAFMAVVLGTFLSGAVFTASAQKAKSKEEIEAKIRELEKKNQKMQANRPQGAELEAIITKYEGLLDGCYVKESGRCADVMYSLGAMYYDQERERFVLATEQYERDGRRGKQPVPDYSKYIRMYKLLSRKYPNFPKLPEAYFHMSQCYLVTGHLDSARIILEQIVKNFPNSPRVSAANFRLGELAFMDDYFAKAYDYFKKVKKDQINIVSWEMNHYRMAECAYITGDFDKAVEYFNSYVEACDRNEYKDYCKEFREYALKYIKFSKQTIQAAQAAFDAIPTVPTGTGYNKVPWGASIESVKNVYKDLTVTYAEIKSNMPGHRLLIGFTVDALPDDVITLGHKDVGGGIEERKFCFLQNKLIAVIVNYKNTTGFDDSLLVEKINSVYGKPIDKANPKYTWEYNGKMKITLIPNRPKMGLVSIYYEDMPAIERLQKENAAKEKMKVEEEKKKRSDGLGL